MLQPSNVLLVRHRTRDEVQIGPVEDVRHHLLFFAEDSGLGSAALAAAVFARVLLDIHPALW